MDAACFIFAGGGTGGHLFPGIAVAHAIRRRLPDAQIVFMTTARELDRELLCRTDFEQVPQTVRPFSTRPWHWPAFYVNWIRSVRAARRTIRLRRPRAVLGLGGYAAGPPVAAARGVGVRRAILNPDAVPGRANKYLSTRCDLVCLQWDASRRYFSQDAPCISLGCPIREAFRAPPLDRGAARRAFGLDPERRVVLVTGASQGAQTINAAMLRIWPAFAVKYPRWQLLHLTGAAQEAEVRAAYASQGASATVLGFTHDMPTALAAADIVISRAGASTLAELSCLGRASILLPYPYHRDQHQRANGQLLVDAGAAILLTDELDVERNRGPIQAALNQLVNDVRRAGMEAAARELGRPNAADDVAAWMIDGVIPKQPANA